MTGLKLRLSCLLLGLLCAGSAAAQIYKSVDENGNVVFSDQPPADARASEQIKLESINTTAPPAPMPMPTPAPKAPSQPEYSISVAIPGNDTTVPMGPGNFPVNATLTPSLSAGERLQLQLDGQAYGDPQTASTWQLTNIFRGEHQLSVQRLGADGKVVATSPALTIYVHRPTVKPRQ